MQLTPNLEKQIKVVVFTLQTTRQILMGKCHEYTPDNSIRSETVTVLIRVKLLAVKLFTIKQLVLCQSGIPENVSHMKLM